MKEDAKWGSIEEKDANGNVISTKEGLIVGRGDTKHVVSPSDVEKLATTFASYREMADYFGVKEQTFRDNFRENVIKGRTETKMALRRAQITSAMNGNTTMLIWLGKNILGQTDSPLSKEGLEPLPLGNDLHPDVKDN